MNWGQTDADLSPVLLRWLTKPTEERFPAATYPGVKHPPFGEAIRNARVLSRIRVV